VEELRESGIRIEGIKGRIRGGCCCFNRFTRTSVRHF